jgi:hypothetical protein
MSKILCCVFFAAMVHIAPALDKDFHIAACYDIAVNVVTITWKNDEPCNQQFILQGSDDEEEWVNLDTLYNSSEFNDREISWEYRTPAPGGSSYRLKAVIDDYNFTYSKTVFVKGKPSLFEWRVDDSPGNEKLLLQYEGKGRIKGVINVLMQSLTGQVFFKARAASNTRNIEIPIANLGKGKYDIQLTVEGETIWRQRFKKQTMGSEMVCKLF